MKTKDQMKRANSSELYYLIEDGIPFQNSYASKGNLFKSTLTRMKPGQSFELEETSSTRSALYQCAHRLGKKIGIRKTSDGNIRIWLLGSKTKTTTK